MSFEGGKKPRRDVFLQFTCEPIPGVTDLGATDPCAEVAAFEPGAPGGKPVQLNARPYGTCTAAAPSFLDAPGEAVHALALFAYPLHAPGRADSQRVEHLRSIGVPTLFCSGTRDAFGSPEELRGAAALVEDSALHLLEGADHGFATLKSSGRTREDVWREAVDAMLAWLPDG